MKAKTGASLKGTITRKRCHPYIKMTSNYRNQNPKKVQKDRNINASKENIQWLSFQTALLFLALTLMADSSLRSTKEFFYSDFTTGSLGPHLSLGPNERGRNYFFFTFSVRPVFLDNSTIVHTDVSTP